MLNSAPALRSLSFFDCLQGPACWPAASAPHRHTSSPGTHTQRVRIHTHTHTLVLVLKTEAKKKKNPKKIPSAFYWHLPACVFKLGQTALHVFPYKHPPAHLYRLHPSSHSGEGGAVSEVIHGEDAVSFTVVLLGDAAKPE